METVGLTEQKTLDLKLHSKLPGTRANNVLERENQIKLCLTGSRISIQASIDGTGCVRGSARRWMNLLRSWKSKWTISDNKWEFVESGTDNVNREETTWIRQKELPTYIPERIATGGVDECGRDRAEGHVQKTTSMVAGKDTAWCVSLSLIFLPTFLSSDSSLQCPNLIAFSCWNQGVNPGYDSTTIEWRIDSNRNVCKVQSQRCKNTKPMENLMNYKQASETIMLCL